MSRLTRTQWFCGYVVLLVLVISLLSACGNDAKINNRDHAPAAVLNFPDHFSSVSFKCDHHGHMVFIADHGDSSKGGGGVAVINDSECGQ